MPTARGSSPPGTSTARRPRPRGHPSPRGATLRLLWRACRTSNGAPRPDRALCYHRWSRSGPFLRAPGAQVLAEVAAAETAARAAATETTLERNHEGTTVGEADVREVQDHPAPRRRAGHLSEPPSQAEAGVAAAWLESPGSTSPSTSASRSA